MARTLTPKRARIVAETRSQAVVSSDKRPDFWDMPDDWEPTWPLVFWSVAWSLAAIAMGWGGYSYG